MTTNEDNLISWTPQMLKRFKKAYENCEGDGDTVFKFDDNEFVKGYAMYLISYLESYFGII